MLSRNQFPSIKRERNPGMVSLLLLQFLIDDNLFPVNLANYNVKLLTNFLAQSWHSIWSILQMITICFFLIQFRFLADQFYV